MRAVTVLAVALAAAATAGLASAAGRCCDGESSSRAKRGFSAWGGKRADVDALTSADADDGYGDGDEQKRSFSSWGGKRAVASWQESRARELEEDSAEGKRSRRGFYSWGGKRSAAGGVRSGPPPGYKDNDGLALDDAPEEKRGGVRFSSWGGKRDALGVGEANVDDVTDTKRAFSSWGGKRYSDAAPPAMRSDVAKVGDKRAFFSWGEPLANRRIDLYNSNPVQIRSASGPPFFPWGG